MVWYQKNFAYKLFPLFLVLLKTTGPVLNFDLANTPTRFTFPSNKLLQVKIEEFLLPQKVINTKKTHIIVKPIHS